MKLGEIVAPTIKELFVQRLEELILSGELRPGDPLPTEREIADEMKISKTTVHEGLRELIRLGFLETEGRKGCGWQTTHRREIWTLCWPSCAIGMGGWTPQR